jgi:hypothetical protein
MAAGSSKIWTNGLDFVIAPGIFEAIRHAAEHYEYTVEDFNRAVPPDLWEALGDDEEFTFVDTEQPLPSGGFPRTTMIASDWAATRGDGYFAVCPPGKAEM